MKAVIGLGSNIGNKEENIRAALRAVSLIPDTQVLRISSLYLTSPVGFSEQDFFVNAVAEIKTALSPNALLGACLGIEAGMGRERTFKNGPRIIDIDVLITEGFECATKELTVPHPRMAQRAFVIVPLAELYPDKNALGVPFDMSKTASGDTVKRLGVQYME